MNPAIRVRVELITDEAALDDLASLLMLAFSHDPGMQYLCQADNRRLLMWFRAMLRLQSANRQPLPGVKIDGKYAACAVVTAPETRLQMGSLLRWLGDMLRGVGVRGIWRTLTHLNLIGQYQPPEPHYRLEFIAVHPDHQGKGYGRLLLDAIQRLSEEHPASTGIWLETTQPTNVPLYEHCHYTVTGSLPMNKDVKAIIMFHQT
jgi:GNAT superfamily N-acetyltransferase